MPMNRSISRDDSPPDSGLPVPGASPMVSTVVARSRATAMPAFFPAQSGAHGGGGAAYRVRA